MLKTIARRINIILLAFTFAVSGIGCTASENSSIAYRFASAEEGITLRMANTDYFDHLTQNDLDYRCGKQGATLDEFKTLAEAQGEDFTDEEKQKIDNAIAYIQKRFDEIGFKYPLNEEIVFIKSKMTDEPGAGGYTHGNQIYLKDYMLHLPEGKENYFDYIIAHEMFHILSRNDKQFRQEIYSVFGFTIIDEPDYSAELRSVFLSNPDVEKFDSYATFTINGTPMKCSVVTLLTKPYEEGDSFFKNCFSALVPVGSPDMYYTIDQVDDFYDVFGENTGYVITTEECIADNFAYAVVYGIDGREYENPELIQGILDKMKS